jgi:hypothetical protein
MRIELLLSSDFSIRSLTSSGILLVYSSLQPSTVVRALAKRSGTSSMNSVAWRNAGGRMIARAPATIAIAAMYTRRMAVMRLTPGQRSCHGISDSRALTTGYSRYARTPLMTKGNRAPRASTSSPTTATRPAVTRTRRFRLACGDMVMRWSCLPQSLSGQHGSWPSDALRRMRQGVLGRC